MTKLYIHTAREDNYYRDPAPKDLAPEVRALAAKAFRHLRPWTEHRDYSRGRLRITVEQAYNLHPLEAVAYLNSLLG